MGRSFDWNQSSGQTRNTKLVLKAIEQDGLNDMVKGGKCCNFTIAHRADIVIVDRAKSSLDGVECATG